jgi:CRP/FNR family transcriptional regulator, cyclic AMP receptor protein
MSARSLPPTLSQFPLLACLTQSELAQLHVMSETYVRHKQGYIYLADEPSDHVYLLLKGMVKIGIYSPDGREIIKSIQHPYSLFGELGLTGEQRRNEFACALSNEVQFMSVRVEDFRTLMQYNFDFMQAMLLYLGERLRRAERQWESLIFKDVRTRIVEFLKENAGEHGRQVGFEMLLKHGLTQQDIANIVGASRQTVASILNSLRKSNQIYFNRDSILIRDLEKLN